MVSFMVVTSGIRSRGRRRVDGWGKTGGLVVLNDNVWYFHAVSIVVMQKVPVTSSYLSRALYK